MASGTPKNQRVTAYFGGTVQGVGFRYTALRVAASFDLTGYVRNLPDGRVEVVAEGSDEEIQRFIESMRSEMGNYVTKIEQNTGPAEGAFRGFDIRF